MIIENGNGRCFGVLYGERYGEIPRLKEKEIFFLSINFLYARKKQCILLFTKTILQKKK